MKTTNQFMVVAVLVIAILLFMVPLFSEGQVIQKKHISHRVVMYSLLENVSSIEEICQEIKSSELIEVHTVPEELMSTFFVMNIDNKQKVLVTNIYIDTEDYNKKLCIQYMEIIPRPNFPPEQTT